MFSGLQVLVSLETAAAVADADADAMVIAAVVIVVVVAAAVPAAFEDFPLVTAVVLAETIVEGSKP